MKIVNDFNNVKIVVNRNDDSKLNRINIRFDVKIVENRNRDSSMNWINVDFDTKIIENRNDDSLLNWSCKKNKNDFVNVFDVDCIKTNDEN